jgi:hypothetical protein
VLAQKVTQYAIGFLEKLFTYSANDCMDAGGRATQEQLPGK